MGIRILKRDEWDALSASECYRHYMNRSANFVRLQRRVSSLQSFVRHLREIHKKVIRMLERESPDGDYYFMRADGKGKMKM